MSGGMYPLLPGHSSASYSITQQLMDLAQKLLVLCHCCHLLEILDHLIEQYITLNQVLILLHGPLDVAPMHAYPRDGQLH